MLYLRYTQWGRLQQVGRIKETENIVYAEVSPYSILIHIEVPKICTHIYTIM